MKRVCDVLGVARSAAVKRRLRSSDWTDGRQRRHSDDQNLVEQLRSAIENLPSYGYRRAWALLRRERAGRPAKDCSGQRQAGLPDHACARPAAATPIPCGTAAAPPRWAGLGGCQQPALVFGRLRVPRRQRRGCAHNGLRLTTETVRR